MKILIIDDEDVVRMLLRDMVEPITLDVHEASDCKQGLQSMKDGLRPDVVLCDWRTPEMCGIDLLKQMQADSSLKDIPVIMITGLNDVANVEEALNAGAREYLMKPFLQDTVLDKLRMIGFEGMETAVASA